MKKRFSDLLSDLIKLNSSDDGFMLYELNKIEDQGEKARHSQLGFQALSTKIGIQRDLHTTAVEGVRLPLKELVCRATMDPWHSILSYTK